MCKAGGHVCLSYILAKVSLNLTRVYIEIVKIIKLEKLQANLIICVRHNSLSFKWTCNMTTTPRFQKALRSVFNLNPFIKSSSNFVLEVAHKQKVVQKQKLHDIVVFLCLIDALDLLEIERNSEAFNACSMSKVRHVKDSSGFGCECRSAFVKYVIKKNLFWKHLWGIQGGGGP